MADTSSASHVAILTRLLRYAQAVLTQRHGKYTVLFHLGYCGPGDYMYLDLRMRLRQVFNAWQQWSRFERKKLLDAIKNAVEEVTGV